MRAAREPRAMRNCTRLGEQEQGLQLVFEHLVLYWQV